MKKRMVLLFVFLFSLVCSAMAQDLIWSYLVEESGYIDNAAWINDISGNGINDVIVGTDNGFTYDAVYAIEGETGVLLWEYEVTTKVGDILIIPDINNNGYDEVVFSNAYILTIPATQPTGIEVYCVDGNTGELIWGNTPDPQGFVFSLSPIDDITGDGVEDVIAGSQNNWVSVIDGATGQQVWSTNLSGQQVQAVAQICDADNDGLNDVIIGNWDDEAACGVYCLSGSDGSIFYDNTIGNIQSNCVKSIPDVSGNGVDEIVVGSMDGVLYCFDPTFPPPIWMPNLTTDLIQEVIVADDINGDGINEVAVGSWDSNIYFVNGASGDTLWTYTVNHWVHTVQLTDDINSDGFSDLVIGDRGIGNCGSIYCVDGYSGELFWSYQTTDMVWAVTQIGDVNGNGATDMICCSDNGYVYCLEGNANYIPLNPPSNLSIVSNTNENFALFTWDAPEVGRDLQSYSVYLDGVLCGSTTDTEWQYTDLVNGDTYTAGVKAVYDEGVSNCVTIDFDYNGVGVSNPIINYTKLENNYPNPFNPSTTICYELAENCNVELAIFNTKGQLVRTLICGRQDCGEYSVTWNGKDNEDYNVTSGVYLYRLSTDGNNQMTKKMILLK